ncbi:MAG: RluA family pseudouridine synthase [Actinomycetota bacterium]
MISEEIPEALAGQRLDRIVALIADVSRADAARLVEHGGVSIDDVVATSGKVRVDGGRFIAIDPAAIPEEQLPAADSSIDVRIVHADADVIVVDKPPGLVVHPGAGNAHGTLVNGLLARFPELSAVGEPQRPGIVHRLDAGSSGLLVVARTEHARVALIEQFAAHRPSRRYDAVVWGVPEAAKGLIDAPVGRDPRDPLRMAVVANGRDARTEYEIIGHIEAPLVGSRLSCRLQTGRTHQIRVHVASIGHPIVGDDVYSRGRDRYGLTRPFLHAAELSFDHPETGERVTYHAPLPPDLTTWLATTS